MEIDEVSQSEYCSDMIFDFSEFYDQRKNTDCRLILQNDIRTQLHCHRIILANSSTFFFNAFTSGMEEEKTAEVEISCNPLNLFPDVVRFLYTSLIDINDENIMAILEIAYFYDIKILEDYIKDLLSSETSSKIMIYTRSCYDNELTNSLNLLIPYIASNYDSISLSDFSTNLDTITFCKVLSIASEIGTFNGDIRNEITLFLNGTSPTNEEINEINKIISNCQSAT